MSANRLFTLFVAKALIVVIAFTAEVALSSANSMDMEAKEQVQREQELDDQYQGLPGYIDEVSPGQIRWEYMLSVSN
jgi:hypothetical protein